MCDSVHLIALDVVCSFHLRSSYAHFIRHEDSGEEYLPHIVWSGEMLLVDNQIII